MPKLNRKKVTLLAITRERQEVELAQLAGIARPTCREAERRASLALLHNLDEFPGKHKPERR